MESPRQIACVIFPQVMSLDVMGPLQVFASANQELQRQGFAAGYQLRVLAKQPGLVSTSAGISLHAEACWQTADLRSFDTLLIPGGPGVEGACKDGELLAWLVDAEPRLRRLGSVCSGALILARAGLLDGRLATTHWADVEGLRRNYPKVRVEGNRLHTYDPTNRHGDSHVFTSAGVTAGIDLALALLEADFGRTLALAVARRLVMFLKRPGGQSQFSHWLSPQAQHAPRLAALLEWIAANLHDDLSLENLAVKACMSPRTLSRLFNSELATSPGRYVEEARLEAARQLLQNNQAPISAIAQLCGFGHPENLRRTFQKHLAISPQEYAERFGQH